MKTSAISYECLTFMFDYEELGRVSFNYAIGDLHGQSMKSFASKHLITKSCYSSSRTNRKLIVEYL